MVMPLTDEPGSPVVDNAAYREKAIKMLLSNGQSYVKREVAPMIVKSNDKYYQVATSNLPSGPITTTVGINVDQIVSPCPVK